MKTAAVVGLLVIGAVLGWYFVSPLLIDRAVDEPLALQVPSRAQVDAMSEGERGAARADLMEKAGAESDVVMKEPMDVAAGPVVVAQGSFHDVDTVHRGSGKATLYELPDGSHLVRFEDFRVTNGPALVVVLAEAEDPQTAVEVLAGYHELGPLKGNVGNQNYVIASDVDVGKYASVAIWCELFDVLFSPATLRAEPGSP